MKKFLTIALLVVVMTSVYAYGNTHTDIIIVTAVVAPVLPEFELQSVDAVCRGTSAVVTSSSIASHDVVAHFNIIQTNDARYRGTVTLDVQASCMTAKLGKVTCSTDEPVVSRTNFVLEYDGFSRRTGRVGSFDVLWQTRQDLPEATYNALVTLSYTAQ